MQRPIIVYSEDNRFQRVQVLKTNREKRGKYQQFIVEGVIAINALLKAKWPIEVLLYAKGRSHSNWAKEIITSAPATERWELPADLMSKLSDKEETSELLLIASIPHDDLQRINLRDEKVVVVFDRPSNPGNLGSSIRSAEALGAAGVIITGHATDLYHPHTVRGTMGAIFMIPVVRLPSYKELLTWHAVCQDVNDCNIPIIGTSSHAVELIDQTELRCPLILVMGNETDGLSRNFSSACTRVVKIPMLGRSSSLNLSCATSIMLYEILRQRRAKELTTGCRADN